MNVIVLSFDRLPKKLLGCYGNALIETPGFDRWAAESIVFEEHYAEDVRTEVASHAWWTGCYHFPRDASLFDGRRQLFDVLSAQQVTFRFLVEKPERHPVVPNPERVEAIRIKGDDDPEADPEEAPFAQLLFEGLKQIAELSSSKQPWLLWLKSRGLPNFLFESSFAKDATESHTPLREHCIEHVELLDDWLTYFFDQLEKQSALEQTCVILTAARGELLWDLPERVQIDPSIHPAVAQTPLMIRLPGNIQGSRRRSLVQSIDLPLTLLDLLGLDIAQIQMEGRSLLPLVRDEPTAERQYACFGSGPNTRAIATTEYLLTHSTPPGSGDEAQAKLFLQPEDFWLVNEVQDQHPDEVERLSATLERFMQAAAAAPPVDLPELATATPEIGAP